MSNPICALRSAVLPADPYILAFHFSPFVRAHADLQQFVLALSA
jgi:hypothetical protein